MANFLIDCKSGSTAAATGQPSSLTIGDTIELDTRSSTANFRYIISNTAKDAYHTSSQGAKNQTVWTGTNAGSNVPGGGDAAGDNILTIGGSWLNSGSSTDTYSIRAQVFVNNVWTDDQIGNITLAARTEINPTITALTGSTTGNLFAALGLLGDVNESVTVTVTANTGHRYEVRAISRSAGDNTVLNTNLGQTTIGGTTITLTGTDLPVIPGEQVTYEIYGIVPLSQFGRNVVFATGQTFTLTAFDYQIPDSPDISSITGGDPATVTLTNISPSPPTNNEGRYSTDNFSSSDQTSTSFSLARDASYTFTQRYRNTNTGIASVGTGSSSFYIPPPAELSASSNLTTNINNSNTLNVVQATSLGLGTDTVNWTISRNGANVIGETISVSTTNCSVTPSSQSMGTNVTFVVDSFSGTGTYSAQASVTDTENSITYYAKLTGSVSAATWTLSTSSTNIPENTAISIDWDSNYQLKSGSLFQTNSGFQEAGGTLNSVGKTGTFQLTSKASVTGTTDPGTVTLRPNSTTGTALDTLNFTIYNVPGTPTNATFSSRTETSITVTGVAGSPNVGTLQVKLGTGGVWQTSPHNFTGLTHTSSYDFYVRQVNGIAISATGGPFTGTTLDATPSNSLELGGYKGAADLGIYYYASCVTGSPPVTSEASAGSYTVAGIEAGANVLLSRAFSGGTASTAQHKVNSGSWTTANTQLVNGDTVKFRILSVPTYGAFSQYTWTLENANSDSLRITSTSTVPAPTDITFSTASTASATTTTTVTGVAGDPNVDSTSVRQGLTGGYSPNGTAFTATRGTSYNYQAINTGDGINSAPRSEVYSTPYLPIADLTITEIPDQNIGYTDSSFTVSITGGNANQVYQLRTGGATGTVRASGTGNNINIVCSAGLPSQGDPPGSPVTYTVTTYRTTASGGDASDVSGAIDSFVITRTGGVDTPNAFDSDLGPDLNGVSISSGNYESQEAAITGLEIATDISITGGSYRIKPSGGSYGSWTNASVTNGFPVGGTIQIRGAASTSYSTATTVTVTIGGVSGTIVITTEADPNPGGDPPSGGGGTGTYGLRTYDTSGNISLDISDRVFVEAVQNSYTFGVNELTATIDIDPSSLGITGNRVIWTNPPTSVLDGTTGAPKEDILIELAVSGSTLTLSRQASGSTPTVNYIVVKDD